MKISALEVRQVARLARLELDEQEIAGFQKDLNAILDYMDLLKALDTSGVDPTVHPHGRTSELRMDAGRPSQGVQDALANTPHHQDGSIVVPRVLE